MKSNRYKCLYRPSGLNKFAYTLLVCVNNDPNADCGSIALFTETDIMDEYLYLSKASVSLSSSR